MAALAASSRGSKKGREKSRGTRVSGGWFGLLKAGGSSGREVGGFEAWLVQNLLGWVFGLRVDEAC